jgi:uncharacterized membrane protein (GlpM family)
MIEYILVFIAGGLVSLLVTYAEVSGYHFLSEFAALFPTVTIVSYIFLGRLVNDNAVSRHAFFVLTGTLCAWLPYMFIIYYCAPRIGTTKALILGLSAFVVLAFVSIKLLFHH